MTREDRTAAIALAVILALIGLLTYVTRRQQCAEFDWRRVPELAEPAEQEPSISILVTPREKT